MKLAKIVPYFFIFLFRISYFSIKTQCSQTKRKFFLSKWSISYETLEIFWLINFFCHSWNISLAHSFNDQKHFWKCDQWDLASKEPNVRIVWKPIFGSKGKSRESFRIAQINQTKIFKKIEEWNPQQKNLGTFEIQFRLYHIPIVPKKN